VRTTADFSADVQSQSAVSSTTTVGGTLMGTTHVYLTPGTHYYWRVRMHPTDPALGAQNCWRPAAEFTTDEQIPVPVSPIKLDTPYWPWKLQFQWKEVADASGYTVEVVSDAKFTTPL